MTANLDAQVRYAQLLAESSLIPRHLRGNPANVLLFLALAEAHGLMPAVAFSAFQVIGDTPTAKPEWMRGQIMKAGHTLTYDELTDERCVLTGKRADNGSSLTVTWDIAKARTAGLDPNKGTWAKYRTAMLSARATAELARALFPDCLGGVSYTAEELGAEVDEDGKAVEAHRLAMEDQARVPPPTSGTVEKVKGTPEDDPFTVASAEDAPPPPPESRVTDQEWFDGWLVRVTECDSLAVLKGLYGEAKEQHRCGKLTKADFEAAVTAKDLQKAAIERADAPLWPDVTQPPDAEQVAS